MGVVLAKDLIDSDPQNRVTLVDISFEHLNQAEAFIKSEKLTLLQRDIEDEEQRDKVFEGHDVAICALLHRHSLPALETSVQKGIHFVDMIGEWSLKRKAYDEEAKKKDIALINGIGVSPGITNICVARAVHLLDETDNAFIYVGGNPVRPRPPLNYRIVYALDSVLDFYERKVPIFRDGKLEKVPPLSAAESIQFPQPFSEMECFYSDGLSSLIHTMEGRIKGELSEKTIRYKGHAQGIETLKECGFFSKESVRIGEQEIVPRNVLMTLLEDRMKLGDEEDATLLRVIVSGKRAGQPETHVFEMVDFYDTLRKYTSMGKVTSFPASITAQMITSGKISQRGSFFPEDVFHNELYEPFIEALKVRGVLVSHKVE